MTTKKFKRLLPEPIVKKFQEKGLIPGPLFKNETQLCACGAGVLMPDYPIDKIFKSSYNKFFPTTQDIEKYLNVTQQYASGFVTGWEGEEPHSLTGNLKSDWEFIVGFHDGVTAHVAALEAMSNEAYT